MVVLRLKYVTPWSKYDRFQISSGKFGARFMVLGQIYWTIIDGEAIMVY